VRLVEEGTDGDQLGTRGAKTALCAGLAVFVLAHLWSGVYLGAGFAGLITPKLAFLPVAWGLLEAPIGTLVGAWLYRE